MEQTYLSSVPNRSTQPGTPTMDPQPIIGRDHNKFDLSHSNYLTARYGEVTPFFAFDTVEGDKVPFGSSHEIRSFTMTAPLMSRIRMCKDYFSVPMPAMLRRNWEIIYRTPKRGDDVPANCGLSVDFRTTGSGLTGYLKELLSNIIESANYVKANQQIKGKHLVNFIQYHFFAESILSAGSLLNLLGYHAHTCCRYQMPDQPEQEFNYDDIADKIYAAFKKTDIRVTVPAGDTTKIYRYVGTMYHDTQKLGIQVNFHRIIDVLRNNLTASVVIPDSAAPIMDDFWNEFQVAVESIKDNHQPFNYERLIAYQAVCSQFFSNDNIDNLYTFQLYEDNAYSLVRPYLNQNALTFTYNGVQKYYDTFSGAVFLDVLKGLYTKDPTGFAVSSIHRQRLAYMNAIFGMRKSLRYADYFNGARTSPLAVGDVNAPVVGNKVSAIDMTQNILMQRFLNAVMKVGSRLEEYAKGIFGANVGPDYHEPKFVSHSVFSVGANEVDNTADNQGNIVQTLRSTGDKFEFEVDFDIPSILIGVCYFDSPLVYTRNADKAFFKTDRYDKFNPMLQNIGDQPIIGQELNLARIDDDYFGYAPRYSEYKSKVSTASGGFVKMLPAWAFVSDNDNSGIVSGSDDIVSIDSDFIRSNPAEFDRFYSSLHGTALGTYFHFIIRFDNTCQPLRPMEYASTIL